MFDFIWNEWFWLHPGTSWADFEFKEEGGTGRNISDVFVYPVLITIVLTCIRQFILIPFIFTPIGKYFNVRSKPYQPPKPNAKIEKLYAVNRSRPPRMMLVQCAKDVGWEERKVERWLRIKALSSQRTTMEKFQCVCFDFTYYTLYCAFGIASVCSKDFYHDSDLIAKNFLHAEPVPNDLWWHFMIATSFYMMQTVLLLRQERKIDFYQMLIHHICTFSFMPFNWIIGSYKAVNLCLLFTEVADIPLSVSKIVVYCGYPNLGSNIVPFFLALWIITRLYMFPVWAMLPLYRFPYIIGNVWPAVVLQLFTMTVIFILTLMWTAQMIPVIVRKILSKETITDERSSCEDLSDDNKSNSSTLNKIAKFNCMKIDG